MSKKIDLNWSVYDITKTYPEVVDIMVNLGFDELNQKKTRFAARTITE